MHLRFDGKLGYPGGMIDPGETIIQGVEREILEETNLKVKLTPQDFIVAMQQDYSRTKNGKVYEKIKLYFFAKEIDEKSYLEFEEESRKAKHFGEEVISNQFAIIELIWKQIEKYFFRFLETFEPQFTLSVESMVYQDS